MYYVEMLRVLRALKTIAIILSVLFLIMLVFRIWMNKQLDPAKYISASSTAVKTEHIERDGSETTIIDDRAHATHVEIHRSRGAYRITIIDKTHVAGRKVGRTHHREEVGGSMGADISDRDVPGVGHVTTIERNSNLPLDVLLIVASFLAAFMATAVGNGLSKESEHLELPWTKPVSRTTYALAAIVVDFAGILAAFALGVVAMVAMASLFGIPHLVKSPQSVLLAAVSILFPLSWYAVLQGMTSSLRRASGLPLGLSWPIGFLLVSIAPIKWSAQPLLQFINTLNPIAYLGIIGAGNGASNTTLFHNPGPSTNAMMLLTLTLLGLIAAIVQWRRLEA
ncbi:MAG: hypothetical protein M3Z14_05615 [Candidatus Eremiobacteraeota bacterium]|nr:hypothetical protein [Candidatus Eremiobacteraeota bacterium]